MKPDNSGGQFCFASHKDSAAKMSSGAIKFTWKAFCHNLTRKASGFAHIQWWFQDKKVTFFFGKDLDPKIIHSSLRVNCAWKYPSCFGCFLLCAWHQLWQKVASQLNISRARKPHSTSIGRTLRPNHIYFFTLACWTCLAASTVAIICPSRQFTMSPTSPANWRGGG